MGKTINVVNKDSNLNTNELAFCYEYVANKFNGTKAAISAGYSKKTADVQASQLLTRLKIQNKVKELTEKHLNKIDITAESVIREIAKLGFSDMANHIDFDGENIDMKSFEELGDNTACIKEFDITETEIVKGLGKERKIKFKLHDKKGALELLGKHLQIFNEQDKNPNVNINIDAKDLQGESASEIAKNYHALLGTPDQSK
jgi:phage terminase small subunit